MSVVMGLTCAAGSIACALAARHSPEIVEGLKADEESRGLGTIDQQAERNVSFQLLNPTRDRIEIVRVETSCSCTQAHVDTNVLEPGETTVLTTILRVGSKRGSILATIDVLYRVGTGNAGLLRRLPLSVHCTVVPHYTVEPEQIHLDLDPLKLTKPNGARASITITATNGPPLTIVSARATHPAIQVDRIIPNTVESNITIYIVVDPTRIISPTTRAEIVVTTDSKMENVHSVPVRVVLTDDH
jgi:hypothetical protein